MKRYVRKLAALAKISAAYGQDAAPTGAADAMQMTDVTLTPMAGEQVSRDLLLPYLGHQGVMLTGTYVQLEGSVEIAGAGTAGDTPAYGPLLRACGLGETITAGTMVEYEPVSEDFEDASIYYNLDGVNHIMLGSRGTFTFDLTPKQIPRFKFKLMGLFGTIADQALPVVDLTKFVKPVPVSKANTTLSLHGANRIAESLSIDLANSVEARFLIGDESMEITDRQMTGTAVVEAKTLATVDWFTIASDRTRGVLAAQHGTQAGNIVMFDAPAVEIGRPTQGASQKIANYSLPLMLCPVAGGDELKITVK